MSEIKSFYESQAAELKSNLADAQKEMEKSQAQVCQDLIVTSFALNFYFQHRI